jgi:hypothetical protein
MLSGSGQLSSQLGPLAAAPRLPLLRVSAESSKETIFTTTSAESSNNTGLELRVAATSSNTTIGSPPTRIELRRAATTATARDPVEKSPI